MAVDKRVTLSILEYYDERLKDWVIRQIDDYGADLAQTSWEFRDELVTYFYEKEAIPTSLDGVDWDPATQSIDDLTADKGPYAVIVLKRELPNIPDTIKFDYYVRSLDFAFTKYATDEDLEQLRADVEKESELEII